jgi:hypothetical protein
MRRGKSQVGQMQPQKLPESVGKKHGTIGPHKKLRNSSILQAILDIKGNQATGDHLKSCIVLTKLASKTGSLATTTPSATRISRTTALAQQTKTWGALFSRKETPLCEAANTSATPSKSAQRLNGIPMDGTIKAVS